MKQKLIALMLMFVFILTGCTLLSTGTTPKRVVQDFFGKYQSLNNTVIDQLSNVIKGENLTSKQRGDYENLIKKQYKGLTYTIKKDVIDGDKAVVTAEIEVYNFAKVNKDVQSYAVSNENEFLGQDNRFSSSLYEDYKLSKLKNVKDRIRFTLDLELTKDGNAWKLDDLNDVERQKIHGLYNA